jgi:acyl-CoA synthetase (NDP forming)
VHNLLAGGFEGNLYPVNPGRDSVLGLDCHARLADLPETVDHVVFAISDRYIETAVAEAIDHGAAAATIMSQLLLADDPGLAKRVEQRIRAAGIMLCGPNCMGFYNCHDGVWVCGFDTRENHVRGGNVTLVSHSGSGMSGIVDVEERIDFNLAVSTGQELNVDMADYVDFAIEKHGTRAIGLFMETLRRPEAMIAALEKANKHRIPVVALKVGRTELSARLAQSHSGAMAGEDAAFDAMFDRYGVQRVQDIDELVTALILFAQPRPVADGGLVALHDSGGERQLLIDLADSMGTPLAKLGEDTITDLEQLLDPGLPAVNPLDAWGAGGPDYHNIMKRCLAAMMSDPAAAFGAVVHARAPHSTIYTRYIDYLRAGSAASGKPACLISNRQGSGSDPLAVQATREGFPVLDGLRPFLAATNCLFAWRDFHQRKTAVAPTLSDDVLRQARSALQAGISGESASLELLGLLGLPVSSTAAVASEEQALAAAESLGYPVVLKTTQQDLLHKTEQRGVHLNLAGPNQVREAWRDLAERLGQTALVAPMADPDGLEMALGMIHDPQFGPMVMLGFGGVRLEALNDVVFAIPPIDADTARRRLESLMQSRLFDHDRGSGRPDIDAFCEVAALLSSIVASLADATLVIGAIKTDTESRKAS